MPILVVALAALLSLAGCTAAGPAGPRTDLPGNQTGLPGAATPPVVVVAPSRSSGQTAPTPDSGQGPDSARYSVTLAVNGSCGKPRCVLRAYVWAWTPDRWERSDLTGAELDLEPHPRVEVPGLLPPTLAPGAYNLMFDVFGGTANLGSAGGDNLELLFTCAGSTNPEPGMAVKIDVRVDGYECEYDIREGA